MRLREIDKQVVYVSFLRGYKNGEPTYSEPYKTMAQVQDTSGRIVYSEYGKAEMYDAKALFEFNDINKYINEHTRFWFNIEPISNKNYNYVVARKGEWKDGILSLKLSAIQPNMDKLFIYKDNELLEYQGYYDSGKLTFKIPQDSFMHISLGDKVFTSKPSDPTTSDQYMILDYYTMVNGFKVFKLKNYVERDSIIIDNI